jgi:glycosyltransferase involved in cell wall biosynthesis
MKIVIDVTYSPSGGSLTQIINMIEIFTQTDWVDVVIYSKKRNNSLLSEVTKNNKVVISNLANLSIIGRIIWGQFLLPLYLMKEKPDILFCPGNLGPIYSPVKTVIWIGTIGPFLKEFYTNYLWTKRARLYINKFFMVASSRTADAVIFESQFTQELFARKYNIKINKSHVINIGFDDFFTHNKGMDYRGINTKLTTNSKFILCVSHLYPYKNIIRLLNAYKQVVETTKTSAKLIIAGSRINSNYNNEIDKRIIDLNIQNDVVILGKVNRGYLKHLYLNAYTLVFPSPFENFAYTLVEAMSCGTPIVCSNTTAMPETCGNAALYFDPYNTNEMAEKISLIIENDLLRQEMSERSIIRSKDLPNYKEVTLQTLNIMKELANE